MSHVRRWEVPATRKTPDNRKNRSQGAKKQPLNAHTAFWLAAQCSPLHPRSLPWLLGWVHCWAPFRPVPLWKAPVGGPHLMQRKRKEYPEGAPFLTPRKAQMNQSRLSGTTPFCPQQPIGCCHLSLPTPQKGRGKNGWHASACQLHYFLSYIHMLRKSSVPNSVFNFSWTFSKNQPHRLMDSILRKTFQKEDEWNKLAKGSHRIIFLESLKAILFVEFKELVINLCIKTSNSCTVLKRNIFLAVLTTILPQQWFIPKIIWLG